MARIEDLVPLFWERIPRAVARGSATLGTVLADGSHFFISLPVAALAPIVSVLLGMVLGALHGGQAFSSSLAVLIISSVVAGLGSAVGAYLWLGFIFGDVLFADHSMLNGFGFDAPWADLILHGWVPLALSYLILAGLLVVGPVLGVAAHGSTASWLTRHWRSGSAVPRTALFTGGATHLLVQAGYAFLWAESAAFLIRPLWSYANLQPDTASIQPLQTGALFVATAAVIGVGLRLWMAARSDSGPRLAVPRGAKATPLPLPVRIASQAALLAFLLSGLTSGLQQLGLLFCVLLVVATLRLALLPRARRYSHLVRRIPVVARIACVLIVAYLTSKRFVAPAEQSFTSMLATITASLMLSILLLPAPDRAQFSVGSTA